jgi:hypothetical protein
MIGRELKRFSTDSTRNPRDLDTNPPFECTSESGEAKVRFAPTYLRDGRNGSGEQVCLALVASFPLESTGRGYILAPSPLITILSLL